MKKIELFFALALMALPIGATDKVEVRTVLTERTTDFVHDECVFDTLYPTFRYLYETITRIEKAGPTEPRSGICTRQ